MFRTLAQDVRLGVRGLLASRMQAGIAILTLALGIGLTTAAFTVLDSLIFRPLPFVQADRFVGIWNKAEAVLFSTHPRERVLQWQQQSDLFDRLEAHMTESVIWQGPRGAEMISGAFVTPGLLSLLGVAPSAGRLFVEGDGRDGSDALVVISERFWRGELASAPDPVGRTLTINDRPHTVVGMMPASFRFPNSGQDFWLPLDLEQPPATRMTGRLQMVPFARVAPGVTRAQLDEQVEIRGGRILEATGGREGMTASVHYMSEAGNQSLVDSMLVLGGAALFLLLIVCANVANLALSRALVRARDLAVRTALGASRRDLIRETLVENAVLGLIGVGLGLLAAHLLLGAATGLLPASMFMESLNEVNLDTRALLFTAVTGLATVFMFGLPPALIASRATVADLLRTDSRSTVGSRASRRLRSVLVVAEVTISIVLLVGAALMARSFVKLQGVDRGFDSSQLVALRVGLPTNAYGDPRLQDRFSEDLIAALDRVPGVERTTAGGIPPDSSMITFGTIEFEHAPDEQARDQIFPIYRVWPDYFQTTGIPLRTGRTFSAAESRDSVIISESMAAKFWPSASPVGGGFDSPAAAAGEP